jgi:FAD:protein FMN transferase
VTTGSAASEVRLATTAMGTRFELVAFGSDPARLRSAGEAALEAIEETHHRFTRFEPGSLLSHIHRTAWRTAMTLDRDAFRLFADALDVWRASDGAFDPAWQTPAPGCGAIELDPARSTIRLQTPVRLDLSAIAKGHGLDLAGQALREQGIGSAFVHGGTSSAIAIGRPPDGDGWRVRLGAEPDGPVLALIDEGLSVSASRRPVTATTDPARHLVDPETGQTVGGAGRAAVVGPSARLADAWSTAIVVKGGRRPGAGWRVWVQAAGGPWRDIPEASLS